MTERTGAPPAPVAPAEAIAWHKQRLQTGDPAAQSTRQRAFTIAGVAQADLVAQVHQEIERALRDGTTFEDFKKAVGSKLEEAWQGTVKNPASRLETIFRTNTQAAYNAGRYAQATDPKTIALRPFWQFDAVLDARTTKGCKQAHGTVLPHDDPWWQVHMPPLHFNCRSTFHPLTKQQAERVGITTERPPHVAAKGFGALPVFDPGPAAPSASEPPKPSSPREKPALPEPRSFGRFSVQPIEQLPADPATTKAVEGVHFSKISLPSVDPGIRPGMTDEQALDARRRARKKEKLFEKRAQKVLEAFHAANVLPALAMPEQWVNHLVFGAEPSKEVFVLPNGETRVVMAHGAHQGFRRSAGFPVPREGPFPRIYVNANIEQSETGQKWKPPELGKPWSSKAPMPQTFAHTAGSIDESVVVVGIHEVGHHLLYIANGHNGAMGAGTSLLMETFRDGSNESDPTQARPLTVYARSDEREYFAESFAIYCCDRQTLVAADPAGYKLVIRVLEMVASRSKGPK